MILRPPISPRTDTLLPQPSFFRSAGPNAWKVGMDVLCNNCVLYEGLQILGHGATLAGIILGSIAVMIIDGKLVKAAAFAAVGGALTFFGLIHSEAIGVMKMPAVAAAYMEIGRAHV